MKISRWMAWVLSLALLAWGAAWAQGGDPTLDQIYQAANSGQLGQARSMIEQVLKDHPKSAKAHYVKAEIAARQREASVAQEELSTAERLAPGLPFAKPQSVQALRTQIQDETSARSAPRNMGYGAAAAPAPVSPGLPWGKIILGLIVAFGVIALIRRMMPSTTTYGAGPGSYGGGYGGAAPGTGSYGPGPGYGPGGVPQPGGSPYGAPGAQPSMGSTLGRGLATGLAVGAGAVAAEEIGHRLFDHRGNPVVSQDPNLANGNFGVNDPAAMDNVDMGGQNFGVNDGGSWDDNGGGGMDAADIGGGGGGDWDNS